MRKKISTIANYNVPLEVTLLVLLCVTSIIIIIAYIVKPICRKELTFIVAVIGGGAMISIGYYTATSLKVSIKDKKKEHSYRILGLCSRIDIVQVRLLIETHVDDTTISRKEWYKRIIGDKGLLGAVTTLLGMFEDISLGIRMGYFDEEVLFYSLGFLLPWHFFGLKYYVDEERRRTNTEYLYWETEKLADAWKSHRSLSKPEKVYTWPS